MAEHESTDEHEHRPRITASLDELSDEQAKLMQALGQMMFAVASMEMSLRLETSRLTLMAAASRQADERKTPETTREQADDGVELEAALAKLDKLPAGQLLERARRLKLPDDLCDRIWSVVTQRNDLVHHPFENVGFVQAIRETDGPALVDLIAQVNLLSTQAAELTAELVSFAIDKLQSDLGITFEQAHAIVTSADLDEISDPRVRDQLTALRLFENADELSSTLDEIAVPASLDQPADSVDPEKEDGSRAHT